MAEHLLEGVLDQTTDRLVDGGRETPIAARPRTAAPDVLPRAFGRYQLQRLLGRGAMGVVYLAHDSQLDRLVALKIPRPLDEDPAAWRERFRSEARAAATLHHPNICPVFEVGEFESQLYLTMAYIEGETLAARLRRAGALPVAEAVELVRTISRAMAEAHDRGIVHRDLKPANIMLDRRGQPVIMDFGLALRAAVGDDLRLTLSGVALGTPCYMPPEQAGGDLAAIGPPADVYSLGVMLYELVTGRLPFEGRTFGKLLAQIERDPAPPPQSVNAAVDERLAGVILRALAKRPEERFASAQALADALDAYVAGAPAPAGSPSSAQLDETSDWQARPAKSAPGTSGPSRINWRRVAVGLAGLAAAALLGVVIYVNTNYGKLVVELSDPAADVAVKVNGEEVILDPESKSVRIRAREDQQLDVSGPGFKSISKTFDLRRGETTKVRVKLEPNRPIEGPPAVVRSPAPVKANPPESAPPPVTFAAADALIELPGWQLVAGATQEEMKAWLAERKRADHSVLWLDGALIDEKPVFAAIAALDDRANDWHAFVDLTDREVNDVAVLAKRELDPTNYVVTSIGGYIQGKTLTGVGLYHRGTADGMAGVRNMLSAKMQITLSMTQGYVARVLRPVSTSSDQLYCGMYSESAINTPSRHTFGSSESALTAMLDQQRKAGAHPVSIVPYDLNGQRQYAATFLQDPVPSPWEWLRDLTAADLKTKSAELASQGMAPTSITVYPSNGEARYAVVWRQLPTAAEAGSEPPSQ